MATTHRVRFFGLLCAFICGAAIIMELFFTRPIQNADPSIAITCQKTLLNFVAHPDDDLLFLSPDLLQRIRDNDCVRTVFVTAADDNNNATYWLAREEGVRSAYALMAQTKNDWHTRQVALSDHTVELSTLADKPNISLIFMRLPDGNSDGSGFPNDNHQSLQKLWQGKLAEIHTVDGVDTYTKETLISTFTAIIEDFEPHEIHTQDFIGRYGDGDHSDHHTVAYITQRASRTYKARHILIGYEDYTTLKKLPNVAADDYALKYQIFSTYAKHDRAICDNTVVCQQETTSFKDWAAREYQAGTEVVLCTQTVNKPQRSSHTFYDFFFKKRQTEASSLGCGK
ncbi:MAG TPA: PIG-L family deacetylase [Candidatus Saccharimonas sp.]|nr:PIG-L family deacetylase [Candidatus Saccharimonas sp.]